VNGFIDHLHHSELQVITALSLISTLYKSLATLNLLFAFTSGFLVTDLNNGDSSVSVLTSLLSGEYPATELVVDSSTQLYLHLFSDFLAELGLTTNP
jgi:hypothetical protein